MLQASWEKTVYKIRSFNVLWEKFATLQVTELIFSMCTMWQCKIKMERESGKHKNDLAFLTFL